MPSLLLPTQTQLGPQGVVASSDGNMWFTDETMQSPQTHNILVYVIHRMVVKPTSLNMSVGQTAPETVTETDYGSTFSATSSNTTIATVAQGPNRGTFNVTAVSAGSCTITISDTKGNAVQVLVTVN